MRYTSNKKLKKIELTDAPPDITVLDDNWDVIDSSLADFDIWSLRITAEMASHSDNSDIHVTASDKSSWNSKAAGSHNHDTSYAPLSHSNNSDIHVTAAQKSDWNSKASGSHTHDTAYAPLSHSNNSDIHVTTTDKSNWNGKAPGSHSHSASSLTGTLAVSGGGSGRSTLTSGYFLRGNGTSAVTLSSPSAVLSAIGAAEAPVALYNNTSGTTGTITLSQSSANFLHMRVYFRDNDGIYNSVDAYSPNGKSLWLGTATIESHGTYFKRANIKISGNSITFTKNTEAAIQGTRYDFYTGNYIYVTRVEAWN